MVGGLELRVPDNGYIDSLRGVVDAAEFECHARYLIDMSTTDFAAYENEIDSKFRNKEVLDFLSYINSVRSKRENTLKGCGQAFGGDTYIKMLDYYHKEFEKEFKNDIAKLRYHYETGYCDIDNGRKDHYYKLFNYTKRLLWKIVPGNENSIGMMNILNERLRKIDDKSTLEESLRMLCLLSNSDDIIDLSHALKGLLLKYHPDKNQYEQSQEIFYKIEQVYSAVQIISRAYESHSTVVLCDLKEFLGYGLEEITEENMYYCMKVLYKPFIRDSTETLKKYEMEAEVIPYIEDNILKKF
uniref:hypothetical protein n=1 Tax=Wolbachia endosymbiont of Pentidionis agamae TaxID=3110435 RepID=UPI002FD25F50